MHGICAKHQFERAAGSCRHCGHGFCTSCLVYPFGADRPGLCIPCALVTSGVNKRIAPVRVARPTRQRSWGLRRRSAAEHQQETENQPAEVDWSAPFDSESFLPSA